MRMSTAGTVVAGVAVAAGLSAIIYLAFQAVSALWAFVLTVLIVAALGGDPAEVNAHEHHARTAPAVVDAVHAADRGMDRHP